MLNIGWFSTGRGEGSKGLLRTVQDCILDGQIDAGISFVFSNRGPGEAEGSDSYFDLVRSYGLPLATFSSRDFRRALGGNFADHRVEYDRKVMDLLDGFSVDLCVLAGYMLIAGPELCRRWPMVNLHPALPSGPIGTWQEVTWSLIETFSERTGAMAHLATDDLDRGPVVSYFTVSLRGLAFDQLWDEVRGKSVEELKATYGEEMPLFRRIREEEYRREPYLLVESLKALASGRVQIRDGRVVGSHGEPLAGLCLDGEIEKALGVA